MTERRGLVLLLLAAGIAGCGGIDDIGSDNGAQSAPGLTGIRYLAADGSADDGFARAVEPRPFRFPADHAAHPDYRTEWWYFTGNVFDARNRHYGFELTVFRIALEFAVPTRDSTLAANEVWMAHLAVTDTERDRFQAAERLSRGAPGLAGVAAATVNGDALTIAVEDWSIGIDGNTVRLAAGESDFGIAFELTGLERIVLQGDDGLDRKGPEPGNASYYYSAPRLAVTGELRSAGEMPVAVTGSAWLDREWGTSALSPGISGWDWFALQLDDGSDLMFYRLRADDGSMSPFSGGTLTAADGTSTRLSGADVELTPTRSWTSPASRIRYPVAWQLAVPDAGLKLDIRPRIDHQEIDLTVRYWEGAVAVSGSARDAAIGGVGYLELAGY